MSHEIEQLEDGKYSFVYTGEPAWHGLGTKIEPNLTPLEMLKVANLDWNVKLIPAYALFNGKQIPVNHSALIRESDEKVLDVVGNDWKPVQTSEAFDFFTDFVKSGNMEMHTAGSLQGGKMVWALAKIKDQGFELFKGDKVDSYLLFSDPFKYGFSIDIRFTPIRVVCNNTLTLSLSDKETQMVKISHAKKWNAAEVKALLNVAAMKMEKYKEMAKFLGSKRYTEPNVMKYFQEIFPVITAKEDSKKIISLNAERAHTILKNQPGVQFATGTWWQAANAITFLTDHLIGRSADARLTSAWYGANKGLKLKALEKAVEYAKAA